MVTFTCNACGDSVKKDKVDTHYRTKCPECNVLSCIDCGKDFAGEGYRAHNSCISEAEKYQGALYKPKDKANKGDIKQQQWLTNVHLAKATIKDPKMKSALDKISKYQNVPRKQKKFINFAKNSLKIYDEAFLGKLFGHFSGDAVADKPKMSAEIADKVATAALPSIVSELKGAGSVDDKKRKRDNEAVTDGDTQKKNKTTSTSATSANSNTAVVSKKDKESKTKKKHKDATNTKDKKKSKKSKKSKKEATGAQAAASAKDTQKKEKKSKKSKKSKKEAK
eukprot:m.160705 g.160705  ORF g.160705 m.160705 type:complete len:280 (-) comp18036_c0_seq3:176-1015(-)